MPHRQEHAMMGRGGRIRVPASESAILQKVLQMLGGIGDTLNQRQGTYDPMRLSREIARAMDQLKKLEEQVSEGFHRNPYMPFRIVGPIAEDVYDIRYRHRKDGKDYEHEFNGSVNILAIERHGKKDMLITSERGLPLWDEFPDD